MGEIDGAFGITDGVYGLKNSIGDNESGRLGQTNIFTGEDDQAAGDEKGVLAGLDQAGEIIEGGIGIAGPQAFDKSGNGVVVFFALLVKTEETGLEGILQGNEGNFLVETKTVVEKVDDLAGVTIGNGDQPVAGFLVDFYFWFGKGGQGPVDNEADLII